MEKYYVWRIFEAFAYVRKYDPILDNFVYQELISIINRFVALYRIDDRSLCQIDYENLVGDLVCHFCDVVRQYERKRWADCPQNRVGYVFTSLRRETNRLLHEELDRFISSSSRDKYENTVSVEKWEQIDMDVRYSQPDVDEFKFDLDKWSDKERTFVRLLLEKNKLIDIAKMMDLSYASVRRIKDRLEEKLRERNRVEE